MNGALSIKRIVFAGSLAGGCIAAVVLFFFDPARAAFYPQCKFYELTGLACPGCGSLRALHELLHGHFFTALRFNAFLIASLPLLAWLCFRMAWQEFKGRPAPNLPTFWLWVYLGAWLVFGLVRTLFIPLP